MLWGHYFVPYGIGILSKSQIGLYNAGGSCYMASIIQILIHLDKFLNEFLKIKYEYTKPLSYLFFNFIKEIAVLKLMLLKLKDLQKMIINLRLEKTDSFCISIQ